MNQLPNDLHHIVHTFIHKHRLTELISEFHSNVYNDCCDNSFSRNCRVCNGCVVVRGIKYNYRVASNLETRVYNGSGSISGAYLPNNYL